MGKFTEFLSEGKEEAVAIRTALKKELGLSSRDVSVKASYGGMSSSVKVNIKTMKALQLKSKIENIGTGEESYDRDEASGEILGGGNTFIFVEIDWKYREALQKIINDAVEKESNGDFKEGDQITIFKTFIIDNKGKGQFYVYKKGGGQVSSTNHPSGIASTVMNLITTLKDDSLYAKIK